MPGRSPGRIRRPRSSPRRGWKWPCGISRSWKAKKSCPRAALPKSSPAFILELLDQAGKPLLHLEELGAQGKDRLTVRTREGKSTATVLAPLAPFRQWQEEMHRLTASAKPAGPSPEKGESGKGDKQ